MPTLSQSLSLGEPQVAGPLTVFPVFGPAGRLRYRALSQATELGAFVKELEEGASVGDLLVANPTDLPLLVYEGEEVLGAKQNRTFDSSVLVAGRARVRVPVSCVEQGRWDPARENDHMRPAPQTADPALRRLKRTTANRRAQAGLAARADQGEVWCAVGERLADNDVSSASAAMSDVYEDRRSDLAELLGAVRHVDGQVGAIAAVGGRPTVLDLVSRSEVFAMLLPRLAQGYALDALGREDRTAESGRAEDFLRSALHAPRMDLATPGLGRGLAIAHSDLIGSGLEHGEELVQLSAFAAEGAATSHRASVAAGRIDRPSRRRAR
jgi:ARG/rhodanese/phosphatase superfamily protein